MPHPRNQAVRNQLGACFVSSGRVDARDIDIWIDPKDGDGCVGRIVLAGLGLFPTGSDLPSATSVFSEIQSISLSDRLFLHVLYAPDFPTGGTKEAVRQFFYGYEAANREAAFSWENELP